MASNPVSYSTSPLASQTLSTESVSHAAPWDVFLSFRGPDTRYNFTNHLYNVLDLHGLRTFRDKPELRTGDVIRDELIQAINNSKTYVVVFSEDYATSTWCLDELLEIYKCYKTMNKLVIGVYYHVNPSDVRHQNESFKKSFEKHETGRYAAKMDKVKEWRDALKFVAGFSGQTISSQSDEVDIINEIVEVIQLQINPKTLYVADHPVGLDSRVKHISAWLSRDTEQDMIKIGIYGMGGVGKSTLSKALYNQLLKRKFEASCFLEEIRKKANDIVFLQMQLINDVIKSSKKVEVYSVAQGTKFIQENLRRKVLVVMDDVDNIEQYKSLVGPFAPGSVVIITTRDENILDQIQVERRFEVDKLDNADSEALFTKHATEKFRSDKILMELSKDILSHADGLPLALKIFGSHLSTESERGWRAYINTLSKNPNSTIEEKLSISLEAIKLVDPMLEEIFLDIACSFIGRKKEEVVDIMDTHYSDVEHNIDILKKRCLLTISITHELRMHDLLRDIGEKLARNNHPTDPGKHTRLWKSSDICDVLRKGMGTEAIECVIPRNFHYHDALEGVSFDTKTYKNMSKLRFLYLKSVNLSGSFGQIFEDIKWLRWDCCPWKYLPSDFCLENVVVLVLRCSQINTMWEPNKLGFQMLTSLDMSYSLHLTMTPDFTELPCLDTLNLQGCESLTGVHISVGSLKRLAFLDLEYCKMLRRLPDSFCNLRALKTLNIGNCSSLEAVPTDLGKIVSLTELHAHKLTVSNVPDSIGHLSNLVKLILSYNKKLQTLPDTICNLSALKVLDIGGCSSLEALPLELGNIESLTELNAWGLNVSEFPDSIKHLSKFVQLNLSQNQYHETSHHTKWEVFISFSGVDTRNKFTDQLYNALLSGGIRTYMDDSELSRKELMGSDGLFPAIQKSEAHILVFSKTYASSPLCLDKVVEILNSQKSMGRLVIPVFYNIEKSVVQHQTESFREAFELHQLRFGMEIVNNWRRKLTEVANFPGYHISESSEENDVIRKIVDELLFLSRKTLHVSDQYPVGLFSRVKEITTLLRSNTKGGVIKLGIYGMGGVGKTTLAKALYNQLFHRSFQGSSFLAQAGEVLGTERGLVHLQEKLINDVIGENGQAIEVHNVEEGYKLIRDRICSNKILVVLDNLNHIDQISEYLVGPFASGSVVIITTRDQGLLDKMQVEDRYQYRVKELDNAESLALFNRYAFGNVSPNKSFEDLSDKIVGLSGGNPLALKVSGSYLRNTSLVDWKSYIMRMHQLLNFDIHQILAISLNELALSHPQLQDIFLDICFFFMGRKKEEVVKILETCYSRVDYNISILQSRSLLIINSRDELEMHILHRHMGRNIVYNASTLSRLWGSEDIYTLLEKYKGTGVIEGFVQPDELQEVALSAETFRSMSKLRFLYFKNVKLIGSFNITVRNLRWLRWDCCPLEFLPSGFWPQKLVILEFPQSKMKMLWELNMASPVFEYLKTLNMMYSEDLVTSPDFLRLPFLETLNLEGCVRLEEVHVSIGSLARLATFNLRGCLKLKEIPNTIGGLRALQVLNVSDCNSMEALPIELGNIQSLKVLSANALTVSKLPDSIGRLSMLVELKLNYNKKLEALPDTVCRLESLEILDINGCSSLKELPAELGNIRSLKEFNASALTVSELPESIGLLSKLVQLQLRYNEKLKTLPESISNLRSLQNLDFGYCRHLLSIPELPPNLKCIKADGCTSMKSLPNLSNLEQLEYVYPAYCCGLTEILYKSESCTGILSWKNSLL